MGSLRFDGIRFAAYPMDHEPRHVHGFYAGVEVIVDLQSDGQVSLARRRDAVRPANGNRADVRHVLMVAAEHFEQLVWLWRRHHG